MVASCRSPRLRAAGLLAGLAALSLEARAEAFERQWHVGLEGGYALGGFPGASSSGFAVGLLGTYGLTDAFNLRAHADLSAFDLPEPRTSAVAVQGAVGAEYVFDVLRWVPYVGVTLGPNVVHFQNDTTVVHLGIEVPAGLAYQLTRNWSVGGEARYRVWLFGDSERSPTHGFFGLARVAYAWGS